MNKRRKAAPMLVMRGIRNTELETKELAAALSFKFGTATSSDYHLLLDLTNMLLIAGSSGKRRSYVISHVDTKIMPTLTSIKNRYEKTGKLGVSAAESGILVDLVEFSKQFWMRQPMDLYTTCAKELTAYYAELAERRAKENPS